MRCREEIERVLSVLRGSRYSISELLAVLLVVKTMEPVGRIILSNILGMGDKKARNIIRELRRRGVIRVTHAGSTISNDFANLLDSIKCITRENYTISILPCSIEEANIIRLRDELVLLLGAPDVLIAIGYSRSGSVDFPGIPSLYKDKLTDLVRGLWGHGEEAIAIFSKPGCYMCCSSFLQALITSSKRSDTMSRSL